MDDPAKSQPGIALILERERGLRRSLNARKLVMISLGGSIGTGLFLGTGYAISLAGPAAVVSYTLTALLVLMLVGCLAEMTLAHPTSGSFGAYAEHYLGPLAGFLVRYSYWTANVLAVGSEVAAIALYANYWFPHSPGWAWSAGCTALLVLANLANVNVFGTIEYWFSAMKMIAIGLFILLAGGFLLAGGSPWAGAEPAAVGFAHFVERDGFLPKGLTGVGAAGLVALFSFIGIEMVAVGSGEAQEPERSLKRAFRSTVTRLIVFYLVTVALILSIVSWRDVIPGTSPFVLVMQKLHIPAAAAIVNFVILLAALSAVNSQLYIATRMLFSLARAGHAPQRFGLVQKRGVPANALLLSTLGVGVATASSILAPDSAYMLMMAISIFGALFSWFMIFVTHYSFNRERAREGSIGFGTLARTARSLVGATAVLAILLGTLSSPQFHLTLIFGLPFLACMTLIYFSRVVRKQPT